MVVPGHNGDEWSQSKSEIQRRFMDIDYSNFWEWRLKKGSLKKTVKDLMPASEKEYFASSLWLTEKQWQ